MGVVYKARHIHLDRLSAVKVLLPEAALLPDAVKLFRREARLASSINHPNSVLIYDYGEFGTRLFYLAMEFIPGRSLADVIDPPGEYPRPIPIPRALHITRQICDALYAAHQVGIVHRDLKPQNVMICERTGQPDLVKVVDFGIARSLANSGEFHSSRGVIMGTPAYMSPEQARGAADLDGRSDIYSLGLLIYQMLSGQIPFAIQGLSPIEVVMQRASLRTTPPALSVLRPDLTIPMAMDQALKRALEPDRNSRTSSAARLVEELELAAKDL